jgi:hypothetical protein
MKNHAHPGLPEFDDLGLRLRYSMSESEACRSRPWTGLEALVLSNKER